MPSSSVPNEIVNPGGGPTPSPGSSGASATTLILSHINDLTAAHNASAIAYDGGGVWSNGTTNPATDSGSQLSKIISDLSSTASNSGSHKTGSYSITNSTVTIPANTLYNQLSLLSLAQYIQYAGGGTWANGGTNPDISVEGQFDKIISDLASSAADSGMHKLGSATITAGTVTIASGTAYSQLASLAQAANINYGGGSSWLGGGGGAANPNTSVESQLDKIIADLIANTGVDGAGRLGASASGNLSQGSIRTQLDELDDDKGGLAENNVWVGTNEFQSAVSMTDGIEFLKDVTQDHDITVEQRAGTGANPSGTLTLRGQKGQNQTGATDNNDGGDVLLYPGKPGTGGANTYRALFGDAGIVWDDGGAVLPTFYVRHFEVPGLPTSAVFNTRMATLTESRSVLIITAHVANWNLVSDTGGSHTVMATFRRNGGTVSQQGTDTVVHSANNNADVDVSFSVTGDDVFCEVTSSSIALTTTTFMGHCECRLLPIG